MLRARSCTYETLEEEVKTDNKETESHMVHIVWNQVGRGGRLRKAMHSYSSYTRETTHMDQAVQSWSGRIDRPGVFPRIDSIFLAAY